VVVGQVLLLLVLLNTVVMVIFHLDFLYPLLEEVVQEAGMIVVEEMVVLVLGQLVVLNLVIMV
tara:strand:- start:317 stop:505 length:189 start_codon:yes stop_codon:yes gene_type:complete